jgi:hypothetical protein
VIPGLHHLEGEDNVAALADGYLITGLTVTNGAITLPVDTLPSGASKVLVGLLPEAPELEPLPIGQPATNRATTQGKRKRIVGVTVKVKRTCGLYAGSNDDTLRPAKMRPAATVGPTPPLSRDIYVKFDPKYSKDGTFLIRGTAGLPMTVTALYPDLEVSDATVKLADA